MAYVVENLGRGRQRPVYLMQLIRMVADGLATPGAKSSAVSALT